MTIKYSALLPTYHLSDFADLMDYDFLEPIPDFEYRSYYHSRAPTSRRLLDNGLIEFGKSMEDDLIPYAKHVHATHIIPPDKLGLWWYNKSMAQIFSERWPRDLMYVALAGPEPHDFYDQSDWCLENGFGGVCLPYRLNRVPVGHHTIHLLGLRIPEAWKHFQKGDQITSLDTTEPINSALCNYSYQEWGGIITLKRHSEYQTKQLSSFQLTRARDNIRLLQEKINEL